MESESIGQTLKRLERYIYNLKPARELNMLSNAQREIMIVLRNSITTARTSYEDAINADDARTVITSTSLSVESLDTVDETIMEASQHDLLTTVDVAQLSALTEHINDHLKKTISE